MPLVLFGGKVASVVVNHATQTIKVDDLEFSSNSKVAVLLKELRKELSKLLVKKIESPKYDLGATETIDAIVQIIESEVHPPIDDKLQPIPSGFGGGSGQGKR